MAGLSGYEVFQLVSRGDSPEVLNRAADASTESRTRIQKLSEELRQLTKDMQDQWKGKASDNAAQAVQPIERALQRAQETLDKADSSLRAQALNYGRLRQQVLPMATPEPPELNLIDHITPWDTDNEVARKEWFEADAQNRRAYDEYARQTGLNRTTLPQMSQGPGGAPTANTGVQAAAGPGVKSGSSAPPQVKDATSPSSAGSPESGESVDKAAAPPSTGGGKTSASNAGGSSGGHSGGPSAQTPMLPAPGAPKQPGDRTAVADVPGGMGGVPLVPRPQSGNDSAHKSGVPKGDHLSGGGTAVLPGMGIGDPTGTRGQRGSLDPAERTAVVGKTLANAPAAAGARGAAGKVGAAGMGGFGAPGAHAREEEDREHKRTVYLEEEADAIVGQLPGMVAPVIGED